jgi:hypothetical protein
MLTPTIISLLVGMVLAQRFKVLVLFPVIALALVFAGGAAMARPDATWSFIVTSLLTIVGLQAGYLFGIGVRHLMVLVRVSRYRAASLANSLPPRSPVL